MNISVRTITCALVAVVASFALSTDVFAQPGGGQGGQRQGGQGGPGGDREQLTAEQQAAQQTERLRVELDLVEAQVSQIQALYLESINEMTQEREQMRSSGERPDREKMMERMRERTAALNLKIKSTLSEGQAAAFDALLAKQAADQESRQSQASSGSSRQRNR